jgi:glycosyltransferase involved in cell wall biosynthesis
MTRAVADGRGRIPLVVHVSPTYFSPDSVIGGGERYAEELSRAMSDQVPVRFVSFGPREFRARISARLERVILKSWTRSRMTPFSPGLLRALRGARVVHCYQLNTLPTFLAVALGRLQGSATYVSDLGGGGWTPGFKVDIGRWLDGHLPISEYAARGVPPGHRNAGVIYGGVDLDRFPARAELRHDGSVVFLGRILPHKGIHTLIDGLPQDRRLRVIGPVGSAAYLQQLMRRAAGKQVEFLHGLSDAEVADHLRRAAVLVHPTPVDRAGSAGANELLGLAVLEAMASNCPVVITAAASLPELIENGASGLVVAPNDPEAIRTAIRKVTEDRALWTRLAVEGRRRVERQFTWPGVVERCLCAYDLQSNRR